MQTYRLLFLHLLTICLISCNSAPNKREIELRFEDALEMDIPSRFRIVKQQDMTALLGDDIINYDIQFDEDDFSKLMTKLDLSEWDNSYNKEVYSRFVRVDERTHYTVDLIVDKHMLSYSYSRD